MSKKEGLLDELNIAITLRHASIAHQLVDELIGLGDIEYVTNALDRVEDTQPIDQRGFQSTGALDGTLSMLSIAPSAEKLTK